MVRALDVLLTLALASLLQAAKQDPSASLFPLLSYTFSSVVCSESYIPCDSDSSVGSTSLAHNLIRDEASTSCTPSLGVVSNRADYDSARPYAIRSQQPLFETFETAGAKGRGITFEIWLKGVISNGTVDDETSDSIQPILTVGQLAASIPSRDSDDLSDCGLNHLNFQLAQRGRYLEIMYRTSDTVFEACQHYRSTTEIQQGRLTHIVVSLQDSQQLVFLNGLLEASLSRPFSNSLDHWLKYSDFGLQLMSYPVQKATQLWAGTIHKVALHDSFLNEAAVAEHLSRGLPLSPPFALNYTVVINEDAEQVPESHDPEWYLEQSSVREAQTINLRMEWVDRDVYDLQETFNHTSALELRPTYTYITRLPTVGCLYQNDGTLIGCGANKTDYTAFIPLPDDLQTIVYLPPLNQHSAHDEAGSLAVYTTLTFCVSEKILVSSRQCSSVGTVQVIVAPVNDPPMAINPGSFRVNESLNSSGSPKILLSGLDVDDDDSVHTIQITSPPKKGLLRLSVTSFRHDNLRHGTLLSDLGYEISNTPSDPVYAFYVFDPVLAKGSVVQSYTLSDSFSFRVSDESGTWSVEQIVRVTIHSAVICQTNEVVTVQEDSKGGSSFSWLCVDTSGYKRDIRYIVEAVPESLAGTTLVNGTGKLVRSGDMLDSVEPFPYERGVSLSFFPASSFCSGRNVHVSTLIRFHGVALDRGSDRIASVSGPQDQNLVVTCPPDRVDLTVPSGPFEATAMAVASAARQLPENTDDEYVLRISGIETLAPDTVHERVFVSVSTGAGFLSFGHKDWMRADPVHGRSTQRGGNASFFISPIYLDEIFSNFTFQTHTPGSDAIDIQLEFGSCNLSMTDMAMLNWSTCQRLRKLIPVVVKEDPNAQPKTRLISGYWWQLLQLFVSMICYPTLFWVMARLEDSWSGTDDEETVFDGNEPLWIQHRCPETGDYYYENREDGSVTWLAPVGEAYLPYKEDGSGDEESQSLS